MLALGRSLARLTCIWTSVRADFYIAINSENTNSMCMSVLSVLGSTPGVYTNQPHPKKSALHDVSNEILTYDNIQRTFPHRATGRMYALECLRQMSKKCIQI